ncbi:MAG: DsrE family protein [Thermoleophilia bacterium]|nr:DsrE family protein [Thermoleophilia bacterium]
MSTLGILVNSDKYRDEVLGVVQAAKKAGHDVKIFIMDDGVLLGNELCGDIGTDAEVAYCDHSAQPKGIKEIKGALAGSQFQNATMMHEADKVVVF